MELKWTHDPKTTDAQGDSFSGTVAISEYAIPRERMYSSHPTFNTMNMIAPLQLSGYVVLNARAIALDAPDKLVKRAIKLPFVPQVGTVLVITDNHRYEVTTQSSDNTYLIKIQGPETDSHSFTFRVLELLWDEQQEQFQARCEKIDGQGYERLADAVYWESYK